MRKCKFNNRDLAQCQRPQHPVHQGWNQDAPEIDADCNTDGRMKCKSGRCILSNRHGRVVLQRLCFATISARPDLDFPFTLLFQRSGHSSRHVRPHSSEGVYLAGIFAAISGFVHPHSNQSRSFRQGERTTTLDPHLAGTPHMREDKRVTLRRHRLPNMASMDGRHRDTGNTKPDTTLWYDGASFTEQA